MIDKENQTKVYQKYLGAITSYEREFKKWENRARKIVKIYRDHDTEADTTGNANAKFNILWSNVQTCLPATFSRLPKPDVSRRFRDTDPVGRVASLILERALEFEIEQYPDYRSAMNNSVLDRFLGGRGTAWVRYEPHFKAIEQDLPEDGLQVTEDAEVENEIESLEDFDYECAPVDYVHWKDFGHTVARTWEEVTSVWRCVYMERPALIERFGEELGNKIPLDTKPEEQKRNNSSDGDERYQAAIYEFWDKSTGKAYWLSKGLGEIIDERDDPLELEGFFPCPKPLYATITTDTLVPVPDYKIYQSQAQELNILADRIDGLVKALKVRGVYDASIPELQRLFSEGADNILIPCNDWNAFSEKGGLKGAIDIVDLIPFAEALMQCYRSVDFIKNEIYELMGISDIMRGSADPRETAEAVRTKGQFGSMRLRGMQEKISQYATEILQIKAQIMCKFFQPETLIRISAADQLSDADKPLIMPAIEMLKNEPMRNFRIEIQADSMVQIDDAQEKQERMEFLNATGTFLQKSLPVAQANPQIAPLLVEMLKFGVTAFKVGKNIEGMFDQTMDKMLQVASDPNPKPNPEMMKIQGQQQLEQMKAQISQQVEAQRIQLEAQLMEQRQRNDMAVEQHKQEMQAKENAHQQLLESQREQIRMQHEKDMEAFKASLEAENKAREAIFQRWKEELNAAVKIEVANISASTKMFDKATIASTNEITQQIQGGPIDG